MHWRRTKCFQTGVALAGVTDAGTVGVKPIWRPSPRKSAAAAASYALPSPIRSPNSLVGRCSQFSDVWFSFVAQRRHPVPAMPKGGEGTNDLESTDFEWKKKVMAYTPSLSFDYTQDSRTIKLGKSQERLCVENKTQTGSKITLYTVFSTVLQY